MILLHASRRVRFSGPFRGFDHFDHRAAIVGALTVTARGPSGEGT
jgi:hypothetical protein